MKNAYAQCLLIVVILLLGVIIFEAFADVPTAEDVTLERAVQWHEEGAYNLSMGSMNLMLPETIEGAKLANDNYITSLIFDSPDFKVGFTRSGKQSFFHSNYNGKYLKIRTASCVCIVITMLLFLCNVYSGRCKIKRLMDS